MKRRYWFEKNLQKLKAPTKLQVTPNEHKDEDKIRITRYASENGMSKAVSNFLKNFPRWNESTVSPRVKKYKVGLGPQ